MDGDASFGYWVRRRHKALDLTQDALARQVGCAETTIRGSRRMCAGPRGRSLSV
jgi:hypothetical protein